MIKRLFLTVFFILSLVSVSFAANPFQYPLFQVIDADGNPVAGGFVHTYEAGTTTNKVAYTDYLLTVPASNPIELDSKGEATFYLSGVYKINVKTAADTQVDGFPLDNVFQSGGATVKSFQADYGCDLPTALAALGNVDPVQLNVDCECTIASETSETSTKNISLNVINGGSFKGVAGGGVETLHIEGPYLAGDYQTIGSDLTVNFSVIGTVLDSWWGETSASAINSAQASIATLGGRIIVSQGTHTIASGTIILSNDNITLEIPDGSILNNITATDFTIKITGSDCAIIGPGTIQVPDSPVSAGAGLTELRKATVWNVGANTTIDGVVFQNSTSYTIFTDNVDHAKIINCKFYGGWDDWKFGVDGLNHFAYFQSGGSDNEFSHNRVEDYVQGAGTGIFSGASGARFNVHKNFFRGIGNHPAYLLTGSDFSIVSENIALSCGSGYVWYGNGTIVSENLTGLSSTDYLGSGYQAGHGGRDVSNSKFINNTTFGEGRQVLCGLANFTGDTIRDNLIQGNSWIMTSGNTTNCIRVGTEGTTTTNVNNQILDNTCDADQTDGPTVGTIQISGTSGSNARDNTISGNTIYVRTASRAIQTKYSEDSSIHDNKIIIETLNAGTVVGVSLSQTLRTEVYDNSFKALVSGTTFEIFKEVGTAITEVGYNRVFDNKVQSAAAITFSGSFIANDFTEMWGLKTSDVMDYNADLTFNMADGQIFFLTASAGNRNFNPTGTFVYKYQMDVYNNDSTNTITFDSSGLNAAISPDCHGLFTYTGSEWVGGQVD